MDIFIEIKGDQDKITSIVFVKSKDIDNYEIDSEVAKARKQILEYLAGIRREFNLNIDLKATPFNTKVYQAMQEVAYGSVATYKEIAKKAGNEKACRAVGNANNKNMFVLVYPCHRIVGSNNKIGGFGPGLKYKKALLKLERFEDKWIKT